MFEFGVLSQINHPTAEAISYRYDDMGNRVAVFTLDTGTTLTAQSMAYDKLNRLETVTVAGQGTWAYEYDAVGVREALHAPNGTRTDYHYDDQYRLKRLHTYKIGPTPVDLLDLHYTVDAVGNRTKIARVTSARLLPPWFLRQHAQALYRLRICGAPAYPLLHSIGRVPLDSFSKVLSESDRRKAR